MKKTGAWSIRGKLFAYLALLAGLLILVLWLTQTVFLDDFYKYIKTRQIKSIGGTITDSLDDPTLQTLVERLAIEGETCILVFRDGDQVASADVLPDCMLHRLSSVGVSALQQLAYENGGSYMERFARTPPRFVLSGETYFVERIPSQSETAENMVYITLKQNDDGIWYAVILNSTISPVSATVDTLRIQLVFISAALVLLALLLAFIISRQIARPVMCLNSAAKELARGHYDAIFNTRGFREISELGDTLTHAARELSKVEALRRELIANVSHDLRTPLTMISGFAEVMRDLPGESTPENAQVIMDEAERLSRLVSDLLDLSKLENGMDAARKPVNLTAAAREVVARFNALLTATALQDAEKSGGAAQEACPRVVLYAGEDITVLADETQLQQVLYNLLANAVAYGTASPSPPDGAASEGRASDDASVPPVEVWQTQSGGVVTITVADHGPGIPEEELPFIWERYYRASEGRTGGNLHRRAAIGTGLGLSIVHGVLERFGARHGVSSKPDMGTAFWFSLPVEKEALLPPANGA